MSGKVTKHGVVQLIPVDQIDMSPFQVRASYDDLEPLARDIKKNGLLMPILIRPKGDRYEVVHGHRRLMAVTVINKSQFIEAVVRKLTDEEAMNIQGSENLQREDLSPIEVGRLYRQYMEHFNKTIREVARDFGVNERSIYDYIYLLDLPDDVKTKVHQGEITYRKARALTRLTREPPSKPGESSPRITEHTEAIRVISEDVSLKDAEAVIKAADLVREGVSVEEAIEDSVKDYAARKTRERIIRSEDTPLEIAARLIEELPNPKDFDDKTAAQYPKLVAGLLNKGLLVCPVCGECRLIWECSGRAVDEN